METDHCVFCWTLAPHSFPDEFHNRQQRVNCPTCGLYRLGEEPHQVVWDLLDDRHGLDNSPFPRAISQEIRRRYDESGGREVVIDDWERFRAEAIQRHERGD
jgi:hypothetical protein